MEKKKLSLPGKISATVYELRFSSSGKVSWVGVKIGDQVKKGQALATLDKTLYQKRLDKELADYEKARARFDSFVHKHPGDTLSDEHKFTKTQLQAELDASVKMVELAKYELDQVTLYSPVSGIVVEVESLIAGLNITPAAYPIKILDPKTFRFIAKASETDLSQISPKQPVTVNLTVMKEPIKGEVERIKLIGQIKGSKALFDVYIKLEKSDNLKVNLTGEVKW